MAYQTVRLPAVNRVWTIVSVGEASIVATENGEPLQLTRDLNVVESPRARNSDAKALRFPLAVGNAWSYRNDWRPIGKNSHAWNRRPP